MLVAAGGGWFMSLEQITFFLFSLTVAHGVVPPTHTRVPFLVHPLKTCSLGSVLNPVKQTMKTNHYEQGFRQAPEILEMGRVHVCTW